MTRAAFLRTSYLILWRSRVKHELDDRDLSFGRARSPSAPKETDGPAVRPYQLSRHERKESDHFKSFTLRRATKRDWQSLRTLGRFHPDTRRVRSPDKSRKLR